MRPNSAKGNERPVNATRPRQTGATWSNSYSFARTSYRSDTDAAALALVDLAAQFAAGTITPAELILFAHSVTILGLAAATKAHRRAA